MKKTYLGIDIGSVSVKLVALDESGNILHKEGLRTFGRPVNVSEDLIEKASKAFGEPAGVTVTGTGAELLKYQRVNEFKAIVAVIIKLYPDIRTIFEMGGETSKFIRLKDGKIVEYGINGDCAAGTGSFIDQQAERLHYKVEEVGPLVLKAERSARVAGRCSVFAKSDMIHAQQKGYSPPEVLRGLCMAVVRNFKATIVKGRRVDPNVIFIGGLALNEGVVSAVKETFSLDDKNLIVPEGAEYFGALGAAMLSLTCRSEGVKRPKNSDNTVTAGGFFANAQNDGNVTTPPLSTKNVRFLRDCVRPYNFPDHGKVDVYLGIDIGSVSTNFVLVDKNGDMAMEIYTYTKARPIEVVREGLHRIRDEIGAKINIVGVGTTGSGRELIGELVGADVAKDEITAHKTGAIHICEKFTGEKVDTIFEIGGQDAKYIKIENGVVTDFAMNEACAAGTGSFLEEQAIKLGLNIKKEFANLALSSEAPISLGERCTVFMERDVNTHQLKGNKIRDIVAGLAYSVATNYLNRVVRGRKVGDHIFFQGGTAYNDSVAAAFSQILGKTITVPPHNGVIGAIGAALLARDSLFVTSDLKKQVASYESRITRFRGFDIAKVNYTMREFACNACTNTCDIQEFNVEGEKTYWGDKCSSKFRKKAHTDNVPVVDDLFKKREEILLGFASAREHDGTSARIGIPRAMFFYDRFPFWRTYFETLGFKMVVSDETNKTISHDSTELSIAEPCYPIKLVHGHIKDLLKKGVDHIFMPNVISSDRLPTADDRSPIPYLCPWHQTLPFIMKGHKEFNNVKFIIPTVQFELGEEFVSKCMWKVAKDLNVSRKESDDAAKAAYSAQREYARRIKEAGAIALKMIEAAGAVALVIIGRPYNIYDAGTNLSTPKKLRDYYGMNVIPFDFLPLDEMNIDGITKNMFWGYGKKIIAAAKYVAERKHLHMIYITNFKCGPDSFIKHFTTWAGEKPYLTLQFDEHANDAGTVTRIEAYLDSKGLLKNSLNKGRGQKSDVRYQKYEIKDPTSDIRPPTS